MPRPCPSAQHAQCERHQRRRTRRPCGRRCLKNVPTRPSSHQRASARTMIAATTVIDATNRSAKSHRDESQIRNPLVRRCGRRHDLGLPLQRAVRPPSRRVHRNPRARGRGAPVGGATLRRVRSGCRTAAWVRNMVVLLTRPYTGRLRRLGLRRPFEMAWCDGHAVQELARDDLTPRSPRLKMPGEALAEPSADLRPRALRSDGCPPTRRLAVLNAHNPF
jgi:hypothetical protein